MDMDTLVKEVQVRGDFPDRTRAQASAEAVLSVLAEHMVGGAPKNLAAQLPPELAVALPEQGGGEAFDVDQFDLRVAEREGSRPVEAHRHALAVMNVVMTAITPGERQKVLDQLPPDFVDFAFQSEGSS